MLSSKQSLKIATFSKDEKKIKPHLFWALHCLCLPIAFHNTKLYNSIKFTPKRTKVVREKGIHLCL